MDVKECGHTGGIVWKNNIYEYKKGGILQGQFKKNGSYGYTKKWE